MYPITHTITVYRYTQAAGVDSYDASPTYVGVRSTIVPAGADIAAMYGQPAHTLFSMYTYGEEVIQTSDKIVSGSDVWRVHGAEQRYLAYGLQVNEYVLQKVYNS